MKKDNVMAVLAALGCATGLYIISRCETAAGVYFGYLFTMGTTFFFGGKIGND